MVADGVGYGVGQAFGAGVVAAHDALQFGELADHFGDEVGFAEAGGLFGEGGQLLPLPCGERAGERGFYASVARTIGVEHPLPALSLKGEGSRRHDPLFHQPSGQLRDAFDLVGHRPQFLVEGDAFEFLGVVFQPRLAVLFPEEARIAQAGGQHLAVARDDRRAAILGVDIGGADEGGGEFARAVAQHEIFLVDAQG